MRVSVFIPTYNAGDSWAKLLHALQQQSLRPNVFAVIDSGSSDATVQLAKDYGAQVLNIAQKEFTHGLSRHRLTESFPDNDIFIFMTQDAIPANNQSLANLVKAFNDNSVGVAYGRQLPRLEAGPIERQERLFNYPEVSSVRSEADIPKLGFKTIFCSNSFAAYRKIAYLESGGFPPKAQFGEDTILTAKIIKRGWKIAYVAEATVVHSHGYNLAEEAARYREIGKFHKRNLWLFDNFGKPGKEGFKLLFSQLWFVFKNNPFSLPLVPVRIANKWLAYKKGFSDKP
ncbi:glycosyltransferase [Mucilaginibacter lutimaris]|uniref:Glycosyltransferase n=1 Tax=Mucilaginibacter lutimaris TaxID=931629 RepID=A0ABW2ZEP2_9SPHI